MYISMCIIRKYTHITLKYTFIQEKVGDYKLYFSFCYGPIRFYIIIYTYIYIYIYIRIRIL